ncbi:MAG TPA: Gfo/Idh/MocA family oxidoreductase [Candidatus Baltobacteraceae bacterium]|nr:Gfo/Idh/MocA family oxidoreductase [Candidatus Baltobacteraceae bacterium]
MKRLRVGIVGSSFGGMVHAPAFAAQGRFEVVALASPSNARSIARERNIPHAFASTAAMLEGVELDVVSVASPPFDHHDSVMAALARGKHVLCEKPFALTVPEAEAMAAAAARAGTVCALAHEFRYVPERIAVRELIENGHLGALRQIEVNVFATRLRADAERAKSWWFEKRLGGGLAGAILSHLIDQANWLAGRYPLGSTGYLRTANPERHYQGTTFHSDVDDGAFALLDYGSGLVACVAADATHVTDSALLAVHGEARTAVASGPNMIEVKLFTVEEEETAELEVTAAKHASLASAHGNLPPFVALLDEFANAVDSKPAAYPTFEDGLATQRVLASLGYGAAS